MNVLRKSAVVLTAGTLLAGMVGLSATSAQAAPNPSASGGGYVAPISIDPPAVQRVSAFKGATRHVFLTVGTPAPALRRVIVSGFGAHTPDGFVGKVTGVKRLPDGTLDVTTTRAALNQVLDPGDHHVVQQIGGTPGAKLGAAPTPFVVNASCPGSTVRNIHLDGHFDVNAKLDVTINTSFLSVDRVSAVLDYGDDLDLRLLVDGKLNCKASMLLATLRVPFMVGPVPFVASLDLNADATLAADGRLTLHGSQHLSGSTGFDWTPDAGMRPIGSVTNSASMDDPLFAGTATAQVGVTAGLGLSVAELVKGTIGVRGYVGADANPAWTPWWTAYAGVQGKAGLWVVFIGEVKDWTIFDTRWNLAQALGIATRSLPLAVTGRPYMAQVNAVGGNGPYTYAVATGSALPAGLSMSASGAVTGTPTDTAGCHDVPFNVVAVDARARAVQRTVALTECYYAPPTFSGGTYSVDGDNPALDVHLAAQGDHPPFTFSSSTLPTGYTLAPDGHLSNAEVEVTARISVTVTDAVGMSTTGTVSVIAPTGPSCPPKLPWCKATT